MKKIYTEPATNIVSQVKEMTIATSTPTKVKNDRMHGIGSHSMELDYDGEVGNINDDSFWNTK